MKMFFMLFALDAMEKRWAKVIGAIKANSTVLGPEFLKIKEETKENTLKNEVRSQATKA